MEGTARKKHEYLNNTSKDKVDDDQENCSHQSNNNTMTITTQSGFNVKTWIFIMCFLTFLVLYLVNRNLILAHTSKFVIDSKWYIFQPAPCQLPPEHLQQMTELGVDASRAARLLGANPVACYGTLLGVLRIGRVLPWDNNVDLCLVNTIAQDMDTILGVFSKFNIAISPYDPWHGRYFIRRNAVYGYITVFTRCSRIIDQLFFRKQSADGTGGDDFRSGDDFNNRVCPDGTLPYVTQIVQSHTKPIPSSLLTPPFSSLHFGDHNQSVAVPNGDAEILKYFYPDSWWVTVKPLGC